MVPDAVPIGDWLHQGTSDPREVAARYDEWAKGYDDDLASWYYQAPAVVAETVLSRHPEADSVLDVGCGTGLVGRALRARGFGGRILGSTSRRPPSRSPGSPERMTRSSRQTSSSRSPSRTTASTQSSAWE